jgi:hypothetical protein
MGKTQEPRIQGPPGFYDLSKAEQVRYLQELWDQIVDAPGDIPAPESHLDLAEARLRLYREDPSNTTSPFAILDLLTDRTK